MSENRCSKSKTASSPFRGDHHRKAGVEERITGEEFRNPSVQHRVTPLGEVELLSTHDQLLGGAGRTELSRLPLRHDHPRAKKAGLCLAKEGVLGRFAIDFVVVRTAKGCWEPYAIEVNLRKGGTTHPFLTLQFLTDGSYDSDKAVFVTPSGREKHFVATDHLELPRRTHALPSAAAPRGLANHDEFPLKSLGKFL